MAFEFAGVTVKAKIKGKIVVVDLCSEDKNAYQDLKDKIVYLGKGIYYSYNFTISTDKRTMYFWKYAK